MRFGWLRRRHAKTLRKWRPEMAFFVGKVRQYGINGAIFWTLARYPGPKIVSETISRRIRKIIDRQRERAGYPPCSLKLKVVCT